MFLDPADLAPPLRPLVPRLTKMTDRPGVMPRYKPGPLAEGIVRVVLTPADYENPADFTLYDEYWTTPEPYRVFDVPAEQYERWKAAKAAFSAMGEEIDALVSESARQA